MKRTKVDTPEKGVYRFTFTASAEELEQAVQAVYERTRANLEIPGFAKGEADRAAIEKAKGESFFWYDAVNDCMAANAPALLEQAIEELKLNPVTQAEYQLLFASMEKGFAAMATVVDEPEITLKQYTGFAVSCDPTPLGAHDVDRFIQRRRSMLTEKLPQTGAAANGMVAVMDFEGFLNGVPFAGGKGEDVPMELGAHKMIPGFEEGIVGHCMGDTFELPVTFPADYQAEELAGKPAVFRCTIKQLYLRRLPALDDAFAQKAGGVATMAQYREAVRKQLEEMRVENAMNRARTEIVRQLGQNSEGKLPQILVEDAVHGMMEQFHQQLSMIRKPLAAYLAETNQDYPQWMARVRQAAEEQVRVQMSLLKIARLEGLTPTVAEVNAEVEKSAKHEGCTPEEYLTHVDRHTVYRAICAQRAADFVVAHSTIEKDVKQ